MLAQLTTFVMATTNYTVPLPETAVVVSTWNALHAEGAKYPDSMLIGKYGGFVIEVNDIIMLATDDNMTAEVDAKLASLPPLADEEEDSGGTGAGTEPSRSD